MWSAGRGPAGHPGGMWCPCSVRCWALARSATAAAMPHSPLGSVPLARSLGSAASSQGIVGAAGGSGEREGPPRCPLKSPWFEAGCYLAEQLARLHGLYLKVAGGLKIEEFQLGRECVRHSVSWATPALAHVHLCGRWAGGQGRSPPFPPQPPSPARVCSITLCSPAVCPGLGWGRAAIQ